MTPDRLALSRLGGDEFVLALECPLARAQAVAADVLDAVRRPLHAGASPAPALTASVGIAAWPQHGARERLLAQAQTAMRSVKLTGGNAWAVFDPRMAVDQRAQAAMVADLRSAVARRQFELLYQPKIDARTLRVTAAEALLRWHHPTQGVVGPGVFIPLAERHGLIGEIGNWVVGEACRQAGVWRQAGLRMRVAINLSAYQMRQDDLVDRLLEALSANSLQPGRFTVEITETLALENTQATQRTFERLREAGLHVAIDDFGAGQTSLAYLKSLPASELKMDMGLVRDLASSEDARKIADAVIRLAHALDKRVVAEGVETTDQRDLLVAMGCDELQGYLFARPMTATALGLWAMDEGPAVREAFANSLFQDTRPLA
jgi:EAL domain-containing protein (putative c-di-GMP-specific phosphodiesterase class I)